MDRTSWSSLKAHEDLAIAEISETKTSGIDKPFFTMSIQEDSYEIRGSTDDKFVLGHDISRKGMFKTSGWYGLIE